MGITVLWESARFSNASLSRGIWAMRPTLLDEFPLENCLLFLVVLWSTRRWFWLHRLEIHKAYEKPLFILNPSLKSVKFHAFCSSIIVMWWMSNRQCQSKHWGNTVAEYTPVHSRDSLRGKRKYHYNGNYNFFFFQSLNPAITLYLSSFLGLESWFFLSPTMSMDCCINHWKDVSGCAVAIRPS